MRPNDIVSDMLDCMIPRVEEQPDLAYGILAIGLVWIGYRGAHNNQYPNFADITDGWDHKIDDIVQFNMWEDFPEEPHYDRRPFDALATEYIRRLFELGYIVEASKMKTRLSQIMDWESHP